MRNLVLSLAAVAAVFALTAPAAAQAQQSAMLSSPQDQDNASAAAGTSRPRAAAATGSDRVVCMRINPGASRITRKVCRTQREWEERGGDEVVDPR